MEGASLPNKPILPSRNPASASPKFTLPLPPPPPPSSYSLPLDSLLQSLTTTCQPPTLQKTPLKPKFKPNTQSFLSTKGQYLLNSILNHPIHSLDAFLDEFKDEICEVDLTGLLKGLDQSQSWQRALALFEWARNN